MSFASQIMAKRVQRRLDLGGAAGEALAHVERHAVGREGDGVAELDDLGRERLVVDAAQLLLEPVDVAALDAAPGAVRALRHVEGDAVGVELGRGHVGGRARGDVREGGDDEIVAGDALHLFALPDAGGLGIYRVNFPKVMDANAYALAVTPPAKSLGALLRAAEWMAGSEGRPRTVPLDDDGDAVDSVPLSAVEPDPLPEPVPPEAVPEPGRASPVPPSAPDPVEASAR